MTDFQQILHQHFKLPFFPAVLGEYDFQTLLPPTQFPTFDDPTIHNNFLWTLTTTSSNQNTNTYANFKIKNELLLQALQTFATTTTITHMLPPKTPTQTILYDYSSPNLAKDMHVGHMRSTIIGDCLANLSETLGHTTIRINHVGDCGLHFGMIIQHIMDEQITITPHTSLQQIYTIAQQKFKIDPIFQTNAHTRTYALQTQLQEVPNGGGPEHQIWLQLYTLSLTQYQHIYSKLLISPSLQIQGESFYLKYISQVQAELSDYNMLTNNNGRLQIEIPNSNPLTFIKSESKNNAYTYDTTDIVALKLRADLKPNAIHYVVDNGQSTHFNQLFTLGTLTGWTTDITTTHINFGVVTGIDGTRLKARQGEAPKLLDLISDAIDATKKIYIQRNNTKMIRNKQQQEEDDSILDLSHINQTIETLAIGSIKYYELSKTRTSSYKFNFSDMLRFDGNSFTHITYALARIRAIKEKIGNTNLDTIINPTELQTTDYNILRKIILLSTTLTKADTTKMPHYLCSYLYDLIGTITTAYESSRCIDFDGSAIVYINQSRTHIFYFAEAIIIFLFGILGLPIITTRI